MGSEYYQPHTYLYIRVHYHRIMEPCSVQSSNIPSPFDITVYRLSSNMPFA